MPNSIIQVSNLSKSYTITHEGRERYTALPLQSGQVRDVMAQKAKKIFFPAICRWRVGEDWEDTGRILGGYWEETGRSNEGWWGNSGKILG
jgi:hypothetical protein